MQDVTPRNLGEAHALLAFSQRAWRIHETKFAIEDAYKWLFHATRGGEHGVRDEVVPRAWLEEEWKTLDAPHKGEALLEPLRPDGALVRLNLRPYRARGGTKEPLLAAFVSSAKQFRSEYKDFVVVWDALKKTLAEKPLGKYLTSSEWERLEELTRPHGYLAIDHSELYEKAHHPAYRVMTEADAKRLAAGLEGR